MGIHFQSCVDRTWQLDQFKQMLAACQKADGSCFLGQERSADGGIHAVRDHRNNITSVMWNAERLCRAIQNKGTGMLLSGVVLSHNTASLHTAACTRALMENCSWKFFDRPPYSSDLALSNYHLFTYLKKGLGSQCFNNNELMEGVKRWLSVQVAVFFDTHIQKLIPRYDSCLSSSSDYVEK
jgi:hypothetical protein